MKRTLNLLVLVTLLALTFGAQGVIPAQAAPVSAPAPDCNLPGNLIVNCGFETGNFTGWVTQEMPVPLTPLGVYPSGYFGWVSPEGTWSVGNGFDGGGPGTIRVAQDVAIPSNNTALLTFDYRAAVWNCGTQNREFRVTIEPSGGGGDALPASDP